MSLYCVLTISFRIYFTKPVGFSRTVYGTVYMNILRYNSVLLWRNVSPRAWRGASVVDGSRTGTPPEVRHHPRSYRQYARELQQLQTTDGTSALHCAQRNGEESYTWWTYLKNKKQRYASVHVLTLYVVCQRVSEPVSHGIAWRCFIMCIYMFVSTLEFIPSYQCRQLAEHMPCYLHVYTGMFLSIGVNKRLIQQTWDV